MTISPEVLAAIIAAGVAGVGGIFALIAYAHKEGVRQGLLGHRVDTLEKTVARHETILTVPSPR